MSLKRREFLWHSAGKAALGAALFHGLSSFRKIDTTAAGLDHLRPMTGDAVPITTEERLTRIQKAQKLMTENKIEALILDTGTSMQYFTGVGWWPSERTMVAIIPAKGEIKYVGPAFESQRLHELIKIGTDVRVWEEHESPYKQIATALKDMGIRQREYRHRGAVAVFHF